MEAPIPKEKNAQFSKTLENEKYNLTIKIKDENSIYISIVFENVNKTYEDSKLYYYIKKEQPSFEDYSLEEIYNELSELISKNSIEVFKKEDQIYFSIILPFKKKKTLDFILGTDQNMDYYLFQKIIKQKDDIIKEKDEIIKEKNKIIKEKDDIISDLKERISRLTGIKNIDDNNNDNTNKENDYNQIFKDFNIVNLTPKHKLTNHGNKGIYTILQLQDGRLASGGDDGVINIYNKETFNPELTIFEHSNSVWDLIQLKNGNLVSCSYNDKKMNVYQLLENNKYKLLSQISVGNDNSPRKIIELENDEIGLVAYKSIIFYLNINNKLDEDFNIKPNQNEIGDYRNMISVKPGELVISGAADKIQFFELNSRKLKEIININRDIRWGVDNLLCMMNERCLCVGGKDKITIIDVYQKSIIREVEDKGVHYCLYKLNDNILLTGNNCDITQWKISQTNLELIRKKEKAHQNNIREIIRFNNFIMSCSVDGSIKIW